MFLLTDSFDWKSKVRKHLKQSEAQSLCCWIRNVGTSDLTAQEHLPSLKLCEEKRFGSLPDLHIKNFNCFWNCPYNNDSVFLNIKMFWISVHTDVLSASLNNDKGEKFSSFGACDKHGQLYKLSFWRTTNAKRCRLR